MKYLKNVAKIELDRGKCIGCGMCVTVCPRDVFRIEDKRSGITDRDLCMECSACEMNCPVGALSVRKGVGCANAVIRGRIKGTVPDCGCADNTGCC